MKRELLFAMAIAVLPLSGCNTLPFQSNTKTQATNTPPATQMAESAAKADQGPLYTSAIDNGRIVSLADIDLEDSQTLWIPARYRSDNRNAWFIKGARYVSPDGYSNVGGFLKTPAGYLVAVIQPASTILEKGTGVANRSDQVTVFYQVDKDGNTLRSIATLSGGDIVVGSDSIWLRQEIDHGHVSVVGFDTTGKRVVGPQGVVFATPAPSGGWYSINSGEYDRDGFRAIYVHTDRFGKTQIIHRGYFSKSDYNQFFNSTAVFVNQPPIADSIRTGFVIRLYHGSSSISPDFVKWYAVAYKLGEKPPTHTRMTLFGPYTTSLIGDYTEELGRVKRMDRSTAVDLAKRISLVGDLNQLKVITQISKEGLAVGIVETRRSSDNIQKPVFPMLGKTANLLRSIMGGNVGTKSANSNNDAYTIVTPDETLIALANTTARSSNEYPAYAMQANAAIPSDEMELFLVKHGINN